MISIAHAATEGDHAEAFYLTPEFWVAVSFVLFVALVARKVWKILTTALDARSARIAQNIEEAKQLRAEAQSALAEIQRKQREALKDAQSIVEMAKAEAERLRKRSEEELAASLVLRERQAMDRIAQAEKQATAEVRNMAVDVAIAAARQVLQQQIDPAKANELVDQAITQLPQRMN
jgi:F-type H+-transporting ATPase subunit b